MVTCTTASVELVKESLAAGLSLTASAHQRAVAVDVCSRPANGYCATASSTVSPEEAAVSPSAGVSSASAVLGSSAARRDRSALAACVMSARAWFSDSPSRGMGCETRTRLQEENEEREEKELK